MFRRSLLPVVRPRPSDAPGLVYDEGIEEDGIILSGTARVPATGETYPVKNGYLTCSRAASAATTSRTSPTFSPAPAAATSPSGASAPWTCSRGRLPERAGSGDHRAIVGLERGGLYLDLGCSAGLYTRNLALDGADALGIDISPSMLKEAARRARRIGTWPSFARAEAENLPFGDASFAGAVCGGSLNEFGDPFKVLRETHRALKAGGRLAVMGILAPARPAGRRLQRFLSTGGIRFFAPDELKDFFDRAGFELDPLRTYGPVFFAGATRRP
jgi:SAM-dependent methyltransferase